MNLLIVLIKKECRELLRSKKLFILIIIFLFVSIFSPAIAKLTPQLLNKSSVFEGMNINIPEPTWLDSIAQFVKNTTSMTLLVLIFIAAGSIVEEKSKKTLELLIVKPVSKTKIILSKFITTLSVVTLIYFASIIIFYLYSISIFGTFNLIRFLIGALLLLFFILSIISLTLFASTISKNTVVAGLIGLLSMIVLTTLWGLIPNAENYSPGFITNHFQDLMITGFSNKFIYPAVINIIIVFLSIILSIKVFSYQEIEK